MYRLESCEAGEEGFYETDNPAIEETSLFVCVLIDCLEKEKQSALEKIGNMIKLCIFGDFSALKYEYLNWFQGHFTSQERPFWQWTT